MQAGLVWIPSTERDRLGDDEHRVAALQFAEFDDSVVHHIDV